MIDGCLGNYWLLYAKSAMINTADIEIWSSRFGSSHVHEYAPRHLEAARYPVEIEIYIDGSFTPGDDLPAGWGFTVVSPFPYGEATPTWDPIRGRLLFIVQRRYCPVTTDPQAFHYVGAHCQTAKAVSLGQE